MSRLTVYADTNPEVLGDHTDPAAIAAAVAPLGVRFERWAAGVTLPAGAGQDEVLAAYAPEVARAKATWGMAAVDVIRMVPDHPDRAALRQKFLAEHIHADPEVRFFVEGQGLFVLHADGKVWALHAERGDLVALPAGVRHWFDMGSEPHFACIRFFGDPAGWVAGYTGDPIADRYPRLP